MSLINDALKRANQTPKKNPPPTPPLTTLQPVESGRKPVGTSYLIPVLLVLVLALAGVFLILWAKSSSRATAVAVNKAVAERPSSADANPVAHFPVAPPPTAATPAAVAKVAGSPQSPSGAGLVPAKYGIKISTNLVVRTNVAPKPAPPDLAAALPDAAPPVVESPPPAPEIAAAPPQAVPSFKPEFPLLKLQGIFFRQSNPSVLINGKTLRTGERIEGVKIIRIERENVTLEWSGQIRTLVLDQ